MTWYDADTNDAKSERCFIKCLRTAESGLRTSFASELTLC
jgi:hypothetical protein